MVGPGGYEAFSPKCLERLSEKCHVQCADGHRKLPGATKSAQSPPQRLRTEKIFVHLETFQTVSEGEFSEVRTPDPA